jgi:hypothetical protein
MAFKVGERITVTSSGYGVPKGSVGTVRHVYKNDNVRVRITHNPECDPRENEKTILSVAPEDLARSDCGD